MIGFKLRRWQVTVSGFSEPMQAIELATSRGKALASAWQNDVFSHLSFGEFLKIARCRLDCYQPKPVEITVLGKPAFGLGHDGQYVQFVYPDGEFTLNAHPYDVLPISFRPKAYQDREAA